MKIDVETAYESTDRRYVGCVEDWPQNRTLGNAAEGLDRQGFRRSYVDCRYSACQVGGDPLAALSGDSKLFFQPLNESHVVDRIEGCRDVEAHQCDDGAFVDVADDVIQYLV